MRVLTGLDISVQTLLVWLACHFVGDFAFQSTWMSIEKGKSWEVNFYHCATYTAVFVLFARPSLLANLIVAPPSQTCWLDAEPCDWPQ